MFAVQQKILHEHPVPPTLLNPLLGPAFDRVVMRALAKRPDQRYPGADRLTIYTAGADKASLVSKVKTGMASFRQLRLPISAQSVAGYAALARRLLNLNDVYDAADLRFQQGVDRRTGYRTTQMLVVPIMHDGVMREGEVIGVLQLINNLRGGPFNSTVVEGARYLCDTLAIAFAQRQQEARRERTGFVGALADHFAVPYLAFHPGRRVPAELLDGMERDDAARFRGAARPVLRPGHSTRGAAAGARGQPGRHRRGPRRGQPSRRPVRPAHRDGTGRQARRDPLHGQRRPATALKNLRRHLPRASMPHLY
jgi:hypothetical protein